MPFSKIKRFIYSKNPLVEVVCQLRFPRILSINLVSPALFQDQIRDEYPLFSEGTEQQQQITLETSENNLLPTPRVIQSEPMKNYKFSSADSTWHINLTSTFLALSTSQYTTWEEFNTRLEKPLKALVEIYKPAFFERVGLRYVDAFKRSKLGLESIPWNELIHPFALGFLSNTEVMDEVKGYTSTTELDIGNAAVARINTVLGYTKEKVSLFIPVNQELSFIVDSDMFFGKKSIDQVQASLEYLHDSSSKLIRAIITNKLHEAMEPRSV